MHRFMVRFWALVIYSDTTPTRFALTCTASLWASFLWLPGDSFERPIYQYMVAIAGDAAEMKWAALWTVYAIGIGWRTFASRPRPKLALVINCVGTMLFTASAIAMLEVKLLPAPAAIAADLIMAMASLWVLFRTAINSDTGWRAD